MIDQEEHLVEEVTNSNFKYHLSSPKLQLVTIYQETLKDKDKVAVRLCKTNHLHRRKMEVEIQEELKGIIYNSKFLLILLTQIFKMFRSKVHQECNKFWGHRQAKRHLLQLSYLLVNKMLNLQLEAQQEVPIDNYKQILLAGSLNLILNSIHLAITNRYQSINK